eukprot:COSAG01_NODE_2388_length_7779_cov_127.916384_4_plen_105_part_00
MSRTGHSCADAAQAAEEQDGTAALTALLVEQGAPLGQGVQPGERAVFPSYVCPVLTDIYLYHACSCQEILRMETARQRRRTRLAGRSGAVTTCCPRCVRARASV